MPRHTVVKGETLTADQVACLETMVVCLFKVGSIQVVMLLGGCGGRGIDHRGD